MRELEDFNIYLTPFSKRFKFLQEDKRRSFNLKDIIDIDDFLENYEIVSIVILAKKLFKYHIWNLSLWIAWQIYK